MRFEVSRVLETIEHRLTTDPAIAVAVVDLPAAIYATDLDNGARRGNLLRLGMIIDKLATELKEELPYVYPVAPRDVVADNELTSNEKMTVRRWSDDGLLELTPVRDHRAWEIAALTGLPVVSGSRRDPAPPRQYLPDRLWRCPHADCASFGIARSTGQPPPRLPRGAAAPLCPRHDAPLLDRGPQPQSEIMTVRVDGVARARFAVTAARPVVVGRAVDDDPSSVSLGNWLEAAVAPHLSRRHLSLEIYDNALIVTDTSTNGTVVRTETEEIRLRGQQHRLSPMDVVELHTGVLLERQQSGREPVEAPAVMAEAPTVAMRLPPGQAEFPATGEPRQP